MDLLHCELTWSGRTNLPFTPYFQHGGVAPMQGQGMLLSCRARLLHTYYLGQPITL